MALTAGMLLSCTEAEQKSENYVIGIINPNSGVEDIHLGFIEGLAQYGFVAGRNTRYIQHHSLVDLDKALEEMMANNVDLIFTVSTPATKKTYSAVKDKGIPVVFSLYDPVEGGVIKSLTEPGENITGVKIRGSVSKALDWLLRFAPGIQNIFVPVKFDSPATQLSFDDLRKAADKKGLTLLVQEISGPEEIAEAFKENASNVDAVFMVHSIFISSHSEKIVREAMKYTLPVGGGTSTYTKGAMITYGVFAKEVGRQASRQANLILRGARAGEIPVEVADFYMGVNMELASKAGITVSNDILIHADDIIPYNEKNAK